MLPVSRFQSFLCPGSDEGSSSNKSGRWNVTNVLSIKVETHLAINLSKKNFGGILRLKSVRGILDIGLIYGPRANKQFEIPF